MLSGSFGGWVFLRSRPDCHTCFGGFCVLQCCQEQHSQQLSSMQVALKEPGEVRLAVPDPPEKDRLHMMSWWSGSHVNPTFLVEHNQTISEVCHRLPGKRRTALQSLGGLPYIRIRLGVWSRKLDGLGDRLTHHERYNPKARESTHMTYNDLGMFASRMQDLKNLKSGEDVQNLQARRFDLAGINYGLYFTDQVCFVILELMQAHSFYPFAAIAKRNNFVFAVFIVGICLQHTQKPYGILLAPKYFSQPASRREEKLQIRFLRRMMNTEGSWRTGSILLFM